MNPATRGQQSTTPESSHNHGWYEFDPMGSVMCHWKNCGDWLAAWKGASKKKGISWKGWKTRFIHALAFAMQKNGMICKIGNHHSFKRMDTKMVSGNHFSTRVCESQGLQENMAKNNDGFFYQLKILDLHCFKIYIFPQKQATKNGVILDHHPPFSPQKCATYIFPPKRSIKKKTHQTTHTQHTHTKLNQPPVFSRGIYSRALATGNGKFVSRIFFKWIPTPGQYLGSFAGTEVPHSPLVGWSGFQTLSRTIDWVVKEQKNTNFTLEDLGQEMFGGLVDDLPQGSGSKESRKSLKPPI